MNADTALQQRIGRLTPLADVLTTIARLDPVAPRAMPPGAGCVLAADVVADAALPAASVALRDGWAVDAEATRDAGPYSPLVLQPLPQRIDAFASLPRGTDAVAPQDAVSALGGLLQMMAPVAPGEGVLPAGADMQPGAVLCEAGSRLRAGQVAVLNVAGIASVSVRRPLVRIVNARPGDAVLDRLAAFVAHAVMSAGAQADFGGDPDDAFRRSDADAVIGIGGTGMGRSDRSVIALARAGKVIGHGIALAPGETAALGSVDGRPVLLMPGRIDAVFACWLTIGRALVDRLSGSRETEIAIKAMLARKVTSAIGIAEVVALRREGENVEPLASGTLSLQSLARADGWMLVPAESEGYPAGTLVEMRPLP